ncbi:hypothetical protein DUI87_32592 [Hirundo rustica rustica]|uniref:PP1-binding domain-containing protein n=1 Tax=Hirundo rustica rustica TaxID=333673 RepID=A0A3M0IQC7_HIRRU|nr:hypothetical protein DUI87_32592 [Hirundo rustica rustica]
MLRGSKTPLRVKENESGCPGRKEEASFTPSRDQKSCKATKSKVVRPSKKENFGDGNQTGPPKRALKWPKVPEEHLCQPRGSDVSWQLPGVLSEPPSPLHTRGDCSSSRAVPLGNDFCTPERDKEDGKPDFGLSEQRKKPGGFAAVITAEFGTAQEGFGKRATGTSPTSLKFRRRSTIGLRGSPENNTLIRYLAQQRSSRQGEAFTQEWVCERQNPVKSLETVVTGDSLETGHETPDAQSSKTPRKKKVTFGEVLSPEIFDQSLPANTPLRRGASPGHGPGARPALSEEPLPLLDFGWDDEGVEPLPEFLEGSVAAEAPSPVENAEVADTHKPDVITTRSSTKRKKTKYPCYGKRRKKRVKKSLYGEREMASKKPLLSPIPEIPEVFSSVSSPNSPKADGLFTGAEGDFDTSEYFQQGKETPREKAAKHCSSLIEKEELEGNLLTEPGILEPQDEQERAQRAKRPLKDSVRGDPARRRRRRSSSTFYFPPVENTEITGADLPFSCYSVEEVLSVPRAQEGSLQGRRSSAELRVRRSMRLSRDAAAEGLAWIQLPLPAAPKGRRSISASVLAGAENVRREQNPPPWAAPGKENEGSAALAAAPGSTRRRRSLSEATARETLRAPSQRRRSTNSGCGKDGSNQNHSGAAETLELRWKDVSGISDFLK